MRVKLHSDKAAVAYASKGWEIKLVFREQGKAYEYLLCWAGSGSKETPNTEEIDSFYQLSKVEDLFIIPERGTGKRIRQEVALSGYELPVMCSPEELLIDDDD